mgnify:CR=1 FL=1
MKRDFPELGRLTLGGVADYYSNFYREYLIQHNGARHGSEFGAVVDLFRFSGFFPYGHFAMDSDDLLISVNTETNLGL